MKNYKHAIVKFNGGNGALCCNACGKIVATGFAHEDREHYCDACMLKQVPLDAGGEPLPPAEKPHRGRIAVWRKIGRDNDAAYEGVFLDHPHLTGFVSRTSAVLKGPDHYGEIETLNSRYTLIGAATSDDTVRKAQHLYDSLPVLQVDEGLAYALAEENDLPNAVLALMSVVDRTLADVERTVWERRVAAALVFESNWSIMRELAQRLRSRLLGLPRGKVEIHKQIETICDAMPLVIAPRRDEHDVSTAVAAAHAIHKSAKWAVEHGEAKLDRAQIMTAAWYMRAGGAHDLIDRSERPYEDDDCFDAARMIAEGLHRTIGGRERKREEREQAKPEGVVVMPRFGGGTSASAKEIEARYKKMIGVRFPVARAKDLAAARAKLVAEFPHFFEQIGVLLSDLVEGDEIKLRPTLLLGSFGNGKSRLARVLADALGIGLYRFDGANAMDSSFGGTARRWSTGEHCYPFEAVCHFRIGNPLILVDELDKCGTAFNNGNLERSLMPFIEIETASRYPDPYALSDLNLGYISYLFTANDDTKLQGPLRDRLRVLRMPPATVEHLPALARSLVAEIAGERGGDRRFWPHLNEDEIEIAGRLWPAGGSVRRLRVIVERLLAAREKNARN